jgi:antitoxin CptB
VANFPTRTLVFAGAKKPMLSLDERRRRARYRAAHRGTLEMDWLLGRYAEAAVFDMTEAELEVFERLLAMPDPMLHDWIRSGSDDGELAPLVTALRKFHGLEPQA